MASDTYFPGEGDEMGDGEMGGDTGRLREEIRKRLLETGAIAVGFARAGVTDAEEQTRFSDWIEEGFHAGMEYLERHKDLRRHTDNVLRGTETVISIAFSYVPKEWRPSSLPFIASYAYGEDYHDVIRKRLKPVIEYLKEAYGGEWRLCIDSAPVSERYWALKSGIGKRGENGCVIVDNAGSLCFLAEIFTTLVLPADLPSSETCGGCGKCREACPTGALMANGMIDSSRCVNYLTIEHRGDWDEEQKEILKSVESGSVFFGCDRCMRVCPENRSLTPSATPEFSPIAGYHLPEDRLKEMTESEFRQLFARSPIKRMKFEGLQRYKNL